MIFLAKQVWQSTEYGALHMKDIEVIHKGTSQTFNILIFCKILNTFDGIQDQII